MDTRQRIMLARTAPGARRAPTTRTTRTRRTFEAVGTAVAAFAAVLTVSSSAGAQRGKKPAQEFVRQGLLIVNFTPGPGDRHADRPPSRR